MICELAAPFLLRGSAGAEDVKVELLAFVQTVGATLFM